MEDKKIREIGDVENDPIATLTSETISAHESKGSVDDVIDNKGQFNDLEKVFGKLETGDKITYVLKYHTEYDEWSDELITLVEGMKLSYDNVPIATESEIQNGSDEVELEWEDSDYNYAKEVPNFAVKPPKPEEIKAPFVLKKFVTIITQGQSIKAPFKIAVPEGYTGSIRSLIDQKPRPGIWKYSLLKRSKGSIVIEELQEGSK